MTRRNRVSLKLSIFIGIVCIFFLACFMYYEDFEKRVGEVSFLYRGVSNSTFHYEVKTNDLDCEVKTSLENIKNGGEVLLNCKDIRFGFLSLDSKHVIDDLLSNDITSKEFFVLASPLVEQNEAYAKADADGIELLIIKRESDKYQIDIYSNLFYREGKLYQIDDILDDDTYSTCIKPSVITTNIREEDIVSLIQRYQSAGYEKVS